MREKLGLITIADVFTGLNGVCGALAIASLYLFAPDITLATGLIFLGMVFDGADGYMARRFGTKHDYGRHLDSISDAITFGLAPAALIFVHYSLAYTTQHSHLLDMAVVVASVLVVAFSWTRLYRFTVEGYKHSEFYGLATPAMTFFVLVVTHILPPTYTWHIYVALPLIYMASVLMVSSKVRYPKVRGRLAMVFAAVIVLGLIVLLPLKALYGEAYIVRMVYRFLTYMALGTISAYIFLAPVYVAMGLGNQD